MKAAGVPRSEIFITTKVPGPIGAKDTTQLILNASLPQLGVDYLDLVLIHTPCVEHEFFPNKCGPREHEERLDTWRALLELKAAGKIRAVGAVAGLPATRSFPTSPRFRSRNLVAGLSAGFLICVVVFCCDGSRGKDFGQIAEIPESPKRIVLGPNRVVCRPHGAEAQHLHASGNEMHVFGKYGIPELSEFFNHIHGL